MTYNSSNEILKNLHNSNSKCLLSYSNYLSQWLQGNLQDHYGWHNRIWTIHDIELPALITELINLLSLSGKMLFAIFDNGMIRLTDALFSINLHADIWKISFDGLLADSEVNACLSNIKKANEEMQEALSNIFLLPD